MQNQALPQQRQSQLQSSPNSLLKTLMNSSNPMDAVQKMASQNPQIKNLLSMLNSSNMTPKQFFYQYASSQGINPDQFLDSLMRE